MIISNPDKILVLGATAAKRDEITSQLMSARVGDAVDEYDIVMIDAGEKERQRVGALVEQLAVGRSGKPKKLLSIKNVDKGVSMEDMKTILTYLPRISHVFMSASSLGKMKKKHGEEFIELLCARLSTIVLDSGSINNNVIYKIVELLRAKAGI